jgi:hypothetical protein
MSILVFVHLGPTKVPHLWKNIAATKRKFPTTPITLIYSDKVHARQVRRLNIDGYFYEAQSADELVLSAQALGSEFRGGFWRYSLERLIALDVWHRVSDPKNSFIHIESDILLFRNFPVGNFEKINKLAWIKFNETHDVSAILYSPDSESTSWMGDQIRKELTIDNRLTDMTVLSRIQKLFTNKVEYLPTVSKHNSIYFEGFFDGASIGMWLNGRDPRNNYGIVKRHLPMDESLDKAEFLRFRLDQQGLNVTNVFGEFPLYNLHVHSKNRMLLSIAYFIPLKVDLLRAKYKFFSTTFSPLALFSILVDIKKRHKGSLLKLFVETFKRKFN